MNDKPSKELLSAYLDGEISPSQGPDIERHLDVSVESQQELAEYRRISELIQDLPVESAPPEFRTAVLHAAERQMLLPAGDPPERISGARSVQVKRRWLFTGGLLASAAMLFLAVRFFEPTGPAPTGGSQDVAMQDVAMQDVAAASVSLEESDRRAKSLKSSRRMAAADTAADTAATGRLGSSPTQMGAKQLGGAGSSAPRAPEVAGKTTGFTKAGANKSLARKKSRLAKTVSGGGSGLVFGSSLKNARVGEAVKALERSGDRVTVITLTVVDRRAGLDDLQILLARHQIPRVPGQSRAEKSSQHRRKKSKRDLKKQLPAPLAKKPAAGRAVAAQPISGPKKGELVAVYVEATPGQLAGVLGELQRRKQFVGLNIGRTVAVAQLDALTRSGVSGRERERQGLSRLVKDAPGRIAGTVVAAKSAGAKSAKKESGKPAPQKAKPALRASNSDADVSRPSRQMRLALPAVTFKSEYRKRWLSAKPADDRRTDADAPDGERKNRALADKNAKAKDGKANRPAGKGSAPRRGSGRSQSVQVLFVFVTVTDHGKSRQPPSRRRPASKHPAPRKPASRQPRDGMPG